MTLVHGGAQLTLDNCIFDTGTVFTHVVDKILLGNQLLVADADIEVGNLRSKFGVDGIIGTDLMCGFDWEINFGFNAISFKSR